ncbi:MAG: ABC transporter substrate-binding protein, partial [Candidatus Eremiobacteraeota bacterium]|nr:ABC transporter substrate-binding protein [Candidatus Eremiobacteraeota bacterium]
MLRRILTCILAAVFVGGASLAAVQLATAQSNNEVLTISQGADTDTMDPLTTAVTPSNNVFFQIYDGLLAHDANGKLVPSLATSWKQIAPTKWQFNLRHGVKFSNGDPFTSADVKFTIDKVNDPALKSQKVNRVKTIAQVLTPDPYTVIYVTKSPSALMPGRPYDLRMVDGKYWQAHGDAYMADHPMGTGPYMLKEWKKDDHVTEVANPLYWGGKVAIQTVVWKPIPEAASRVAALQT